MYPLLYGSEDYGFQPFFSAVDGAVYNNLLYNENLYNSAILFLALSEAITGTDTEVPYPQIVKTELIILVETIFKLLNNEPFIDDAITPADVALFLVSKPLNGETLTLADVLAIVPNKILPETVTMIETMIRDFNTSYADFIFLGDVLTKQVTNKGMFDTVRTNDWLSTDKLFVEQWHD
jgi:hypothetical protein